MTPKQRVLREYRNAYAFRPCGEIVRINANDTAYTRYLGEGKTAAQAWADAARHL